MSKMKLNPMTGEFKVEGSSSSVKGTSFDPSNLALEFEFNHVDYQEKFQNKRQALHDMVEDDDGFTREEIHDLVLTANKAVWQESRGGD